MASEPCKLIGKMVVKVNLVGSQAVVWLRWRARAERTADSRTEFVAGKNLNGEKHQEIVACTCVRVFSKCAGERPYSSVK